MDTQPTSNGTQQDPETLQTTGELTVQGPIVSWERAELPAKELDEYRFWTWEQRVVAKEVLRRLGTTLLLLLLTAVVLYYTIIDYLIAVDFLSPEPVATDETDGWQAWKIGLVLAVIVFVGSFWPLVGRGAPRALRVFGIVYVLAWVVVPLMLWQT